MTTSVPRFVAGLVLVAGVACADELVLDSRGRLGWSFEVNGFGDRVTTFGNGESYYTMPLGPDTSRTVDDHGRSWIVVEEPTREGDE